MGLKEEIDKIVSVELAKYRATDRQNEAFGAAQKAEFQPLAALLRELRASVPEEHVLIRLSDSRGTVTVGRNVASKQYDYDVRLEMSPNCTFGSTGEWQTEDGFIVDETHQFNNVPEYEPPSERRQTFDDVGDAVQHVVRCVADKLAFYRHLDEIVQRSSETKTNETEP